MNQIWRKAVLLLLSMLCVGMVVVSSAYANEGGDFPAEGFFRVNPTLPNDKLNFRDDSQESCCANDYTADGQPIDKINMNPDASASTEPVSAPPTRGSAFEKDNPRYLERLAPLQLVECEQFAQLPELASNEAPAPGMLLENRRLGLAVTSYSTNVSIRQDAVYSTDPRFHNTSDFHVQTSGGRGVVRLADVNSYSVCMGRGNNMIMAANTDNGSIITYNGSDRVYLAGNNTNMMTRTGTGHDVIELFQAHPNGADGVPFPDQTWSAYNIYKTAVSGGPDEDTLVIRGTPFGAKWCHIGGYRIAGEYFYVVEFALPPTVTEGPRRQRVNIGQSVEFVVFKGKQYRLRDFLAHGEPIDTVTQSVPLGDPLPNVAIQPVFFSDRRYDAGRPLASF